MFLAYFGGDIFTGIPFKTQICCNIIATEGKLVVGMLSKRGFVSLAAALVFSSSLSACSSADRDDSGAVVEEGYVSAWSIRVGDCLTDTFANDSGEFSDANAVPCNEPHVFEAYHSENISGDTFPSDLGTVADDICYYAFADFVGIKLEETNLTYNALIPTQESWENRDDREVTCIAGMEDGSSITGTLRNAG